MTNPANPGFEEAWKDEIKSKAIDVLEGVLNDGIKTAKGSIFDGKEYVSVYTSCYDMCFEKEWSKEVYDRHGATIDYYLTSTVIPSLRQKQGQGARLLLAELQTRWKNHQIMNKWYKKFFTYVDRFHVKHNSLPTLSEVGFTCFKSRIYDETNQDTASAFLSLIDEEREGEIIDKAQMKSTVNYYENMGMGSLDKYTADLETPLLQSTREFYARKRMEWLASDTTPEYLLKAEQALAAERNRVTNYLNPVTESKLLRICKEEILEPAEMALLEKEGSGCRVLLENDKFDDLRRMFQLFSLIDNGLCNMASIVEKFISWMGNECIKQRKARLQDEKEKNDDPKFVRSLLKLHDKYLNVVKTDFSGHPLFQKSLEDAFVDIVNHNVGQFTNAELLSTFCDSVLKSGGERQSEEEADESLHRVIHLFTYLTDKDFFAEVYRHQFAKRLLNQRSASIDAEKAMIAQMKLQCGAHFTTKMEGMLGDLAVVSEQRSEFEGRMKQHKSKVDFHVQVLTEGFWPTYKRPEPVVPPELTLCMDVYKDWHGSRHKERNLTWVLSLGNASVRATFGKRVYDLQVATLQAVALTALNGGKKLGFQELAKELNLEEGILKPLMHSLSCGKYKVVTKKPAGNKINTSDTFVANAKFSCNKRKVHIPMASLDSSQSNKRVQEDRSIAIEAAIVRIMKARKTLSHQQLIAQVLSQLAFFKPNPRIIKLRIEALIERDYLERSEEHPNTYNYLA